MENLREKLAEYAHEAWAGWMKYMFEKCQIEGNQGEDFVLIIMPTSLFRRWNRQMFTSYSDLSENEKESDREEADRMIKIMQDEQQEGYNNAFDQGVEHGYEKAINDYRTGNWKYNI